MPVSSRLPVAALTVGAALIVAPGCMPAPGLQTAGVGGRGPAEEGLVIQAPRLRPSAPPLSTFNGELASGDSSLASGEWVDWYPLYALAGQTLTVDLSSTTGFDPYLLVIAPTGEYSENDDAEGGDLLHSHVEVTAVVEGVYRVGATSFAAGETGQYKLSVRVR